MVSSKDVAKRAGVSQSTVSRVLNNPSKVSKTNVREVIESDGGAELPPELHRQVARQQKTKTRSL